MDIGAWVALLTGVIITSFFVPNMLRKGTVDLLLVKPIQRWLNSVSNVVQHCCQRQKARSRNRRCNMATMDKHNHFLSYL